MCLFRYRTANELIICEEERLSWPIHVCSDLLGRIEVVLGATAIALPIIYVGGLRIFLNSIFKR